MNFKHITYAAHDINWEIKGRISMTQLEELVYRLNTDKGYAVKPYGTNSNGEFVANVGTYYVDQAYGAYRLEQICNTSGGARNVGMRGTKKEVYLDVLKQF